MNTTNTKNIKDLRCQTAVNDEDTIEEQNRNRCYDAAIAGASALNAGTSSNSDSTKSKKKRSSERRSAVRLLERLVEIPKNLRTPRQNESYKWAMDVLSQKLNADHNRDPNYQCSEREILRSITKKTNTEKSSDDDCLSVLQVLERVAKKPEESRTSRQKESYKWAMRILNRKLNTKHNRDPNHTWSESEILRLYSKEANTEKSSDDDCLSALQVLERIAKKPEESRTSRQKDSYKWALRVLNRKLNTEHNRDPNHIWPESEILRLYSKEANTEKSSDDDSRSALLVLERLTKKPEESRTFREKESYKWALRILNRKLNIYNNRDLNHQWPENEILRLWSEMSSNDERHSASQVLKRLTKISEESKTARQKESYKWALGVINRKLNFDNNLDRNHKWSESEILRSCSTGTNSEKISSTLPLREEFIRDLVSIIQPQINFSLGPQRLRDETLRMSTNSICPAPKRQRAQEEVQIANTNASRAAMSFAPKRQRRDNDLLLLGANASGSLAATFPTPSQKSEEGIWLTNAARSALSSAPTYQTPQAESWLMNANEARSAISSASTQHIPRAENWLANSNAARSAISMGPTQQSSQAGIWRLASNTDKSLMSATKISAMSTTAKHERSSNELYGMDSKQSRYECDETMFTRNRQKPQAAVNFEGRNTIPSQTISESNSRDIVSLEPGPDSLVLAVVDRGAHDGSISKENWLQLQAILCGMFIPLLQEFPGPAPCCRVAGYMGQIRLINCADQRSAQLYKLAISRVGEAWAGAQLEVVTKDEIPRKLKARSWVPSEPSDPDTILEIIRMSNPDMPASDWSILHLEEPKGTYRGVIFSINSECEDILNKSKGLIRFGFTSIKLTVLKKKSERTSKREKETYMVESDPEDASETIVEFTNIFSRRNTTTNRI